MPDFRAICSAYQKFGELKLLLGLLYGRQDHAYNFHYIAFDEPLLSELLNNVGFREVRRWDWRKTEHAEIDDFSQAYLPHMDKENGILMSLNLEALK